MNKGMSGHQSHHMGKDEWITPPEIIESLGSFDLDPCAAINQPIKTAHRCYTKADDGLAQHWFGRVWLNPPYGNQTRKWLEKLVWHRNGIALIFARTETKTFFDFVWPYASGLLFLQGRLHFYHSDGTRAIHNAGAPSVLIAYGVENLVSLRTSELPGRVVVL